MSALLESAGQNAPCLPSANFLHSHAILTLVQRQETLIPHRRLEDVERVLELAHGGSLRALGVSARASL